jgi:hypothetical protein
VLLGGMYVRERRIGPWRCLYLVESVREGGRTRQRIIKSLGRKEQVEARGDLDRLARSAARLAQRPMILSLLDQGSAPALTTCRIGPPLAFERLWQETGCQAVIEGLAAARGLGLSLERACLLTVLHRLTVSGSDRSADAWREGCRLEGCDDLALHHLHRAMGWLGEAPGRRADGPHGVRPALPRGHRGGAAARGPSRPARRAVGGPHAYHQLVFRGGGRREARSAGAFQGWSPIAA